MGSAIVWSVLGASVFVLAVPTFFIWLVLMQPTRKQKQHGFEVKLTPGMTPGLLEKKEDYHG